MVLGEVEDQDVRHESANDKALVNGDIGEHDEPEISRSRLQFARCLGGCDTSSGVLPANTNSDEELV